MSDTPETIDERAQRIVRQEVLCCVSALVSDMANGYHELAGKIGDPPTVLGTMEQASELCYPIEDWESAAIDAGWTVRERSDGAWTFERATEPYDNEETWGWFPSKDDAWRQCCDQNDIEPHEREIFEHWAITDWLAGKLEEQGERVDRDFGGLCVWGRTTTGQAIHMDSVLHAIAAECLANVAAFFDRED